MRCHACGNENRDAARFCRGCGGALAVVCPGCGAENAPDARFCDACGVAVVPAAESTSPAATRAERSPSVYTPKHLAERILRSRSALEGERKHVSVLFADVISYASIAESLDPEVVHDFMDRAFERILAEVHRFEGTVNQFTGDGVMALFGAPLALEDAPRAAVRSALAIQRVLEPLTRELHAERGIEFRMRIGIHSGPVVVGRIGSDLRMDYTAVGDTTNLASRLQALARPGTVLISETTQRLVAGYFDTDDRGELEVKGRSQRVRAYEVTGEREARGRIDASGEAALSPLAGRGPELAQLREALESAREGHGQVVFLVGEAGIGKSRLLFEFRRELGVDTHVWIEGRCTSYGGASAFLPIVDAVRRYLGVDDQDDEAEIGAKLERGVSALGGELGWTLPYLRMLLSLASGDPTLEAQDAATRRSQTFGALKALLLQAAQRRPVVLVIEDLHWIDGDSEDFLAFLADGIAASRVLLVFSHRPGHRHAFGDRSYHARIGLRGLAAAQVDSLTRALLGVDEVPAEVRTLVSSKAEGNPFFLEEVTKSLLESGALVLRHGEVALASGFAEVAVPDRIHDVLMARLDRLGDEPKRALQIASVIGREFAMRLLARVTEAGEAATEHVRELRSLELIYEKAVDPELAYMFKHALTHDVAYESMLVQRRRNLHRTVGLAIEDLYADRLPEHYETLAHHFSRSDDLERALLYHERASEKAEASFATRGVIEHCRAGLEIAGRLASRVTAQRRRALEQRLAVALFYASEFRESGDAYERAAAVAPDVETSSLLLSDASLSYNWAHDYESSERTVARAAAQAREARSATAESKATGATAFLAATREGDVAEYGRVNEEALCRPDVADDVRALLHFQSAQQAEWTGDFPRALAHAERALDLGRKLRLAHLVIWPHWFIGKAHCCTGEYEAAIQGLAAAVDVTDRIGDRAWKSRVLNTLGWAFAEIGDPARARAFNLDAARLAHALGDKEIVVNSEVNLGLNQLALGDPEGALEYLEPIRAGLDSYHPFMRWRYSIHVYDALGQLALARRDPASAEAFARNALERARRHHAPKLEARALELAGRALVAQDLREAAGEAIAAALAVAERIRAPRLAWRSLGLRAELLLREGRRSQAEEVGARARALAERAAATLGDADLRRALLAGVARGD